ncbi:replication initiation protein [Tepidibacter thalassicus]|uniref:Protein involved in initiation of plasmid replication n=1 Tax=Tepidibacter thalassicus DSM 15285 TaxID=1123350 RepID=A0A1M5SVK9_9FIRM|nr:replication initiation protein [Tepidibacter thalassicus]SHH42490.1 Protein involved in initiation of plasmid replication [Tepidibacter thalassicus DSM 15285]
MEKSLQKNLVTKSNTLIEASYNLSTNEQRIILFLASKIQPTDEEFRLMRFKIKDIIDILDVKGKGIYSELQQATSDLISKTLTIITSYEDNPNKHKKLQVSWLASAEYLEKEGIVELEFSSKLKPYLLQLKNRFTSYELKNILKLKSKYSIRIYELMKQYEKIKDRVVELEELRYILGLKENEYSQYGNLKQRILKRAQAEINKKTDINFEFEEIKVGRKVEKIRFIINSKKIENVVEEEKFELSSEQKVKIDTLKALFPKKVTEYEIRSILYIANWDLAKVIEKYMIIKNKKNIDNFVGLMIDAIKNDYSEIAVTNENIIKTRFHNFTQRTSEYTPEEFERIVLKKQKEKWGL